MFTLLGYEMTKVIYLNTDIVMIFFYSVTFDAFAYVHNSLYLCTPLHEHSFCWTDLQLRET